MSRQELLQSYIESGLRAHNQGNIGSAREAYQHALAVAPDDPNAMQLLGVALLQLGQPEQAVDFLERAARKLRDNAGVVGNLAQAYFALGRYAKAHDAFRKANRLDPRDMHYQLGIATSLALQGKLADAEAVLRRMSVRFPQEALVWFNLGNTQRDQRRAEDALTSYRKAVALAPHLADARNNLAGVLHGLLRFEEAEREYRACIELAPDYAIARCNLVSVLIDLGRFSEAEASCREMIKLEPNVGLAHTLLGAAVGHQGRLVEALACHRVAAQVSPRDVKVIETYAGGLADLGYFSEALRWFSRALALNPDSVPAHQMLYTALLSHGCFSEGWLEYGYRSARERFQQKYADIALSRTLPSALNGKHICVLREQGLGDEIYFLRYAPLLQAAGARVTYRASNKIRSLLTRVAEIAEVLAETAPLPPADTIILAGDLPHAFSAYPASALPSTRSTAVDIGLRDVPRRISVFWPQVPAPLALAPLAERITQIRERLAQAGTPPYLGLTWQGGTPPHEQNTAVWTLYKQIGIPLLAAAVKDFPGTFIALQRNPSASELAALSADLGRPLHDFTDLNEDLEGMLALLAIIDEYIGVSNTNMHLRASVGKTARVLVPCPAEWRWMARGRESPWFPGFPIYRQSNQGDWSAALAALKQDLAAQWE